MSSYLFHVSEEVANRAAAADLVDELGHVTRAICTCETGTIWGAVGHQPACPVWQYYRYGDLYAQQVLEKALKILGRTDV